MEVCVRGLWLRLLFAAGETPSPAVDSCTQREAARLLDTYGTAILRYAYSYVHNQSDAEDVLQDVLLQVLRTAPHWENSAHEKAWLLTVTANLCKNRLRYLARHRTDQLSEELTAENREDLRFVWEAVKSLPRHSREAIHLYYYEGCSTREIAQILGRKESTVRSDLHRGRQQLRTILKEEYDFGSPL